MMRRTGSPRAFPSPVVRVALLAAAAALLPIGRAGAAPDDIVEVSIRSPEERKGDYDALARVWLEALAAGVPDHRADLPAFRLAGIMPFVKDPLALIPALEKAVAADLGSGAARDALLDALGRLYVSSGRRDEAKAIASRRGHIRGWWIIGPFGAGTDAPFRRRFAPESNDRLGEKHRDEWRDLEWRRIRTESQDPSVQIFRHVHPQAGVAYLLAQMRAEKDIDALLERGSADTIRIWVDGVLVADEDVSREYVDGRRSTPLRLRAGWHRILVKTANPAWVRITDPSGNPLPAGVLVEDDGIEMREIAPEAKPPEGLARRDPFAGWRSSIAEVEKLEDGTDAAGRTRKLADLHAGLALFAQALGRMDIAVEEVEKAMAVLPDDPMVLLHAGDILRNARYLPESISKNRSKSAFEKALAADPELVSAYERVARFQEQDEEHSKAALKMREGLARNPGFLRGLLRLKSIFSAREWQNEEIEVVREMESLAPASTHAPFFWARYYEERESPEKAIEHYRKAWALDKTSSQPLDRVFEIEMGRGRIAEAEEALREAIRFDPDPEPQPGRLIDFLDRVGRKDEALDLARRFAAMNPQDARRLQRIGELEEVTGRRQEAFATYRKALALDPGNLDLKRYVEARAKPPGGAGIPENGGASAAQALDEYWKPYDEKLEEWLLAIPGEGPLVAKASSLMVLDICVVRVEPDGSYSEYVHTAFKVLSAESKDDLANVETPGSILTLRTITPAGDVLEPVAAEGKGSWVMPGIAPGALIDVAYRADHRRGRSGPFRNGPFYFQDAGFKHAVILTRYVLLLPQGFQTGILEGNVARERGGTGAEGELARVEKTVREIDGGMTAITYEARNVPRLEEERFMPDDAEYIPNAQALEKKTWEDVFASIDYRYAWTTRPTAEIREAAARAAGGKDAPLERARAIYAWVNDLVAKPGSSDAVKTLLEKTGDRTILFKALCDAAGVPTRWAFLRPAEALLPKTDWEYPRAELFPYPHVLIEIEGDEPVYVSLAQRFTPFGRLAEHFEGGKALVVSDGQGRIEMLPAPRPEESATSTTGKVLLGKELEAEVDLRVEMRSVGSYAAKDQFKNLPQFQRDLLLRNGANRSFPGAKVASGEWLGLDDMEKPFGMALRLTAPKLIRESGEQFLVKALLQPGNLVRTFGGRSVRQHPCHFRDQVVLRDTVRIDPGETYRIERLPSDLGLVSALGTYSLTYKRDGDAVIASRELSLLPGRIPPEDFPAFVSFCEKVDSAEAESVVLVKK